MEGALQLAVSNRLPRTRVGSDPQSQIKRLPGGGSLPRLSSGVVNERLIRERRCMQREMQESPYFPAQLAAGSADGALLRKRILTEMPQI
jgi:hypothetical protein